VTPATSATLPDLGVAVDNIVGIVVSPTAGLQLIGSDGGVFSFGDGVNHGSLPASGYRRQYCRRRTELRVPNAVDGPVPVAGPQVEVPAGDERERRARLQLKVLGISSMVTVVRRSSTVGPTDRPPPELVGVEAEDPHGVKAEDPAEVLLRHPPNTWRRINRWTGAAPSRCG